MTECWCSLLDWGRMTSKECRVAGYKHKFTLRHENNYVPIITDIMENTS